MPVFISYKREEVAVARQVRSALRAERLNVWWDENLQGGQRWEASIDEALLHADIVVVLWSEASIKSEWVKHEASIGKARGILVPATISTTQIPPIFSAIQAINMIGWDGSERDQKFRDLLEAIKGVLRRRRNKRVLQSLWGCLALSAAGMLGAAVDHYYLLSSAKATGTALAAELAGATPPAPRGDELGLARQLEGLVQSGEYEAAKRLFSALRESHSSGVGYSAYPEAVFAFEQSGDAEGANQVLNLLRSRMDDDQAKGHGYLAPGRPPRGFLREDLTSLIPRMSNPQVKTAAQALVAAL
jgi:hypothetical protein